MKYRNFVFLFILASSQSVFGQGANEMTLNPTPSPISVNSKDTVQTTEISRERREQALAKLLEGQRFIWSLYRLRSQAAIAEAARLAKQSLQKAVELDPNLAEAYTAMAEIAWSVTDDLDEAAELANTAVKISPNNYGGHHLLARIYTVRSDLGSEGFDRSFAEKAIFEWSEIARLDSRNAEAFAFLSVFYERTGRKNEEIEALKKWLAAANPVNPRFYQRILGSRESLSPESASLGLGKALLDAGRAAEAVEYLNRAIVYDPANQDAIDLLREALESTDYARSAASSEILQRALYVYPGNVALINLLVQIEVRNGQADEAANVLRGSIAKISQKDKISAAALQISLGNLYFNADRFDEAVSAYQTAMTMRGVESALLTDAERAFAQAVFDKIIHAYKTADRPDAAKNAVERARILFGKDDLFADKKLIELYRDAGKRQESLQSVRLLRNRFADDYSLLRLEASILTDLGKVDDAVSIVKNLIEKKPVEASPQYDDFSNYIFISKLYTEAKRGKDAIKTANQAYSAATTDEQKQLARLSLASAQQISGDFKSAEETLRALLKQTPRNPMALNNLGYFFLERDANFPEALELVTQALKIDPTNPSYLDSLGWAYFKLENLAEAEKYLKSAWRLAPASPVILEHLGDLYQKQNKIELAKTLWRKALVLSYDNNSTARLKAKLNK